MALQLPLRGDLSTPREFLINNEIGTCIVPSRGCALATSSEPTHQCTLPARPVDTSSSVRLLGWLPPQDFADVLRECALGFMPYLLQEPTMSGFPLKMFEYLAAGLPVVSTRLHKVVCFEDDVTLCDSNPVQTAALIHQQIESDSMEPRCRRRAVAELYTWRSLADQYRAIGLGERPSPRAPMLRPPESARP